MNRAISILHFPNSCLLIFVWPEGLVHNIESGCTLHSLAELRSTSILITNVI